MKNNKIIDFYSNSYEEDKRLNEQCDNRHKIEKTIKWFYYESILKRYPKDIKILDVSCGTVLYSLKLAKLGYDVTACDLCPKHIALLNEKAKKNNLNINTYVCDARELPFTDNTFDIVLLAGAVYHLPKKEKIRAIGESIRVCKKNCNILIDFLPKLHAIYQHIARYGTVPYVIKDIFYYDSKMDMLEYIYSLNAYICGFCCTDGISRFMADKINNMSKSQLSDYINWYKGICLDDEFIDLSEHAIVTIKKIN